MMRLIVLTALVCAAYCAQDSGSLEQNAGGKGYFCAGPFGCYDCDTQLEYRRHSPSGCPSGQKVYGSRKDCDSLCPMKQTPGRPKAGSSDSDEDSKASTDSDEDSKAKTDSKASSDSKERKASSSTEETKSSESTAEKSSESSNKSTDSDEKTMWYCNESTAESDIECLSCDLDECDDAKAIGGALFMTEDACDKVCLN